MPFMLNYAGGIGSVRGLNMRRWAGKDLITGDPLGGDRRLVANSELLFPDAGPEG